MWWIKLVVSGMWVGLVAGCTPSIEDIVFKFDSVILGTVMNHFTRAGGLIDTEVNVLCVLKSDGEIVYNKVFIIANQTKYPCTIHTTPTRTNKDYILGVERIKFNEQNFTWAKESTKDHVAYPLTDDNVKATTDFCLMQNPFPPTLQQPSIKVTNECPVITADQKANCRYGTNDSIVLSDGAAIQTNQEVYTSDSGQLTTNSLLSVAYSLALITLFMFGDY